MPEIEISEVHGTKIFYDAEKKQFKARLGGREVKKSSQRDLEKIISRFVRGDERVKGIILDYRWREVHVLPIEIVTLRGSRVQYKKDGYMEGEDADNVFVYDEAILAQAKELEKEHDGWLKRWESFMRTAKRVKLEDLK